MGNFTRAWNPSTGKLRFDVVQELREKYPKELWELNWGNIRDRPDLQIVGIVLKLKENYNLYTHTREPLAFALAGYNGGNGGVLKEMRACKLGTDCDPLLWFDNVEKFCMKSKKVHTGGRSACQINRNHVRDTFIRSDKYRKSAGIK